MSPVMPPAIATVDPVGGAIAIAGALNAAGFSAVQIAPALIGPSLYPALTARQLGRVLLAAKLPAFDDTACTQALEATALYSQTDIDAAVQALFATWRKVGPVNDGAQVDTSTQFDDREFAWQAAAPITAMSGHAGAALDAIQSVYGGGQPGPAHGGTGGVLFTMPLASGDSLAAITGWLGDFTGKSCIRKIALISHNGQRCEPQKELDVSGLTPFSLAAGPDEEIIALFGATVDVTLAGNAITPIVDQLGVYFRKRW